MDGPRLDRRPIDTHEIARQFPLCVAPSRPPPVRWRERWRAELGQDPELPHWRDALAIAMASCRQQDVPYRIAVKVFTDLWLDDGTPRRTP